MTTRSPLVLLVDDHNDTREAISVFLQFSGMTPVSVGTAEHALEKLRDLRPDVIISDLLLPGMNGLELLAHVRALPVPSIPFVLLTGSHGLAAEPRAALVLRKPVKPDDLVARLREILPADA